MGVPPPPGACSLLPLAPRWLESLTLFFPLLLIVLRTSVDGIYYSNTYYSYQTYRLVAEVAVIAVAAETAVVAVVIATATTAQYLN